MGNLFPISDNIKVVTLAVLVATTFWFFNALSKDYDKIINYPLTFEFDKDSVVIVDPLPSEVKIDVSSGGWNLLRTTFWFNAKPVHITLDNPTDIKYLTKSYLMPIISNQLKELEINFLLTDTLHINIEQEEQKVVNLVVDSSFVDVEEGHRIVSNVVLSPDTVVITGPRSLVREIRSPYFLKLDDSDIDDDYDEMVDIPLAAEDIMSASPKKVNVKFEVREFKLISFDVGVEPMNFPADSSTYLLGNKAKVSFWIEESQADDISFSDFNITADLSMIQKADSSVQLMLMFFPENALDIAIEPESIKVVYGQ